jgi:hypothetical protein
LTEALSRQNTATESQPAHRPNLPSNTLFVSGAAGHARQINGIVAVTPRIDFEGAPRRLGRRNIRALPFLRCEQYDPSAGGTAMTTENDQLIANSSGVLRIGVIVNTQWTTRFGARETATNRKA